MRSLNTLKKYGLRKEIVFLNLTDLQIELRNIEEHISQLHTEVEKMKPKTEKEKKQDFDAISRLAKKHPISGLSISNAPQALQKEFVEILSYLLLSDEKDIYSRLLYLCRIACGCNLNLSAEHIYQNGLAYKVDDLERSVRELQEYRDTLLIEAFVLANLSKNVSNNGLSMIADVANMMGCDKEVIRVLALVAKAKLIDDIDIIKSMPMPTKNMWCGKLGDYIPSDWIMKQRTKCVSICVEKNTKKLTSYSGFFSGMNDLYGGNNSPKYDTKNPCVVKNQKTNGAIVKKGDVIILYEEEVQMEIDEFFRYIMERKIEEGKIEERTITASNDGVVYYKETQKEGEVAEAPDKYLEVYVVSYFDDFK